MANRVTAAEVKQIITTQKSEGEVTPFITPANLIVTEKLTNAGLGTTTLAEIEKWLSAHFVAIDDPSAREREKEVGDARAIYEGKTAMGLDFTRYGQMVKLLDTTGILANLGKVSAEVKTIA